MVVRHRPKRLVCHRVFPRLPLGVGVAVQMDREVHLLVVLVGPHEADSTTAEGRDAADVVARDTVALHRQVVGLPPGQVAANRPVDLDLPPLRPRHPEAPGRVLVDHQRLRLRQVDIHGEARVEAVGSGAWIVTVAIETPRVGGRRRSAARREDVGDHVEVGSIPQGIPPRAAARVDGRPGAGPGLSGGIESLDRVAVGARVPQRAPPRTVVPPQLALRLLPRGGVAHRGAEVEVAVAGAGVGRADAGNGARKHKARQGHGSKDLASADTAIRLGHVLVGWMDMKRAGRATSGAISMNGRRRIVIRYLGSSHKSVITGRSEPTGCRAASSAGRS